MIRIPRNVRPALGDLLLEYGPYGILDKGKLREVDCFESCSPQSARYLNPDTAQFMGLPPQECYDRCIVYVRKTPELADVYLKTLPRAVAWLPPVPK